MSETGPIYGVELLDSLPIGDGTMRQALPSRVDLEGVKDYRQGQRVVAGYEVLLEHYRQAIEVLREVKEYAEGHHAQEETCVWLHSLTVDIPSRIEIALGQPPDKPSGAT